MTLTFSLLEATSPGGGNIHHTLTTASRTWAVGKVYYISIGTNGQGSWAGTPQQAGVTLIKKLASTDGSDNIMWVFRFIGDGGTGVKSFYSGNDTFTTGTCYISVVEASGNDLTTPVITTNVVSKEENTNPSPQPNIALAAFESADNGVLFYLWTHIQDANNGTPEAGWTELYDQTVTFGNRYFWAGYKTTSDTTPTMTLNNNRQWLAIAFEVKNAPAYPSNFLASD